MSEALLQQRDYTFIVARDGSRKSSPPGLEKHWQVAIASIINIAKKCFELNQDGLTIYIVGEPVQKYEAANSATLDQILRGDYASATNNLVGTLQTALDDYFSRKANKKTKENGEIIIVLMDNEPKNRMAVVKMLVEATKKIDKDEELGISFAQVGDDLITRGFLAALDDDLKTAGAKFDIVDTKVLAEIEDSEIEKFLINAIDD